MAKPRPAALDWRGKLVLTVAERCWSSGGKARREWVVMDQHGTTLVRTRTFEEAVSHAAHAYQVVLAWDRRPQV